MEMPASVLEASIFRGASAPSIINVIKTVPQQFRHPWLPLADRTAQPFAIPDRILAAFSLRERSIALDHTGLKPFDTA
jgi:hypothetical protein